LELRVVLQLVQVDVVRAEHGWVDEGGIGGRIGDVVVDAIVGEIFRPGGYVIHVVALVSRERQ